VGEKDWMNKERIFISQTGSLGVLVDKY